MSLNAGILIIGSLLWDDERRAWRDARLEMGLAETVMAPIRYGRLSGKRRGHTYTMVFSRLCQAGQAKVVRCSHTVVRGESDCGSGAALESGATQCGSRSNCGELGMRGVAVQP